MKCSSTHLNIKERKRWLKNGFFSPIWQYQWRLSGHNHPFPRTINRFHQHNSTELAFHLVKNLYVLNWPRQSFGDLVTEFHWFIWACNSKKHWLKFLRSQKVVWATLWFKKKQKKANFGNKVSKYGSQKSQHRMINGPICQRNDNKQFVTISSKKGYTTNFLQHNIDKRHQFSSFFIFIKGGFVPTLVVYLCHS